MKQWFFWLAFCGLASASVLYGNLYDESLNPSTQALVTLNTTPLQEIVAVNGSYEFQVGPGTYLLSARQANASAEKMVTVAQEGSYRIDLILLGDVDDDTELLEEVLNASDVPTNPSTQTESSAWWAYALATLLALAAAAYLMYRNKTRAPQETKIQPGLTPAKPIDTPLTTDQNKVLRVIDSFNGRCAQKELRKALNDWSEAKVSMELTELEDRNLIRKIKKGRGNIIKKT
ncbi:hypothetical protein HY572_00760 [Candidatus Micrarchaeota archaeon]|nr:hypothetical protein [Candidatus Micrarchaeota archaeon]